MAIAMAIIFVSFIFVFELRWILLVLLDRSRLLRRGLSGRGGSVTPPPAPAPAPPARPGEGEEEEESTVEMLLSE